MKIYDKETQTYKELRIKPGGDTLPIGTIVKYDGKMVDIFDKNNINNLYGYIYGTSNIYVSSTTGADKMLYVPIEPSKNYVVSKVSSAKFRIATNPTVPTAGDSTVTSKVANDAATELSITSGSTDKYLILYYYNSSNDTLTEQEILDSIKIKKQDYTIPEGYEEVTTGIVTGQEYETGRIIDGKKEYGKRINFGALPNNTAKEVDIGLTNIVFTKPFEAIAYKSGVAITLPLVSATAISSNIYIAIINNKINITTKADYSSYTNCFVEIFYTKNTD